MKTVKRSCLLIVAALLAFGLAVPVWSAGQKEAPGAPVTLVLSDWHMAEPHWEKALREAASVFEAENPSITVELETVSYGEKETKYSTEIEARTGPDVFHIHAYSIKSFIEKGYGKDITQFVNKGEVPDKSHFFVLPLGGKKVTGVKFSAALLIHLDKGVDGSHADGRFQGPG